MNEVCIQKIIELFLNNDLLVPADLIECLAKKSVTIEEIRKLIDNEISCDEEIFIINKNIFPVIDAMLQKEKISYKEDNNNHKAKVLFEYNDMIKKREVQDFVKYFKNRYTKMEKILSMRPEMNSLMSINRILQKKDKESVSLCGLVYNKQFTKNGHIILEVEDPTGNIKVIIKQSESNQEMFREAEDIVLDECIGIVGFNMPGEKQASVIFATEILIPDVPNNKELKKSPDEAYAVFLSDIHIGSTFFCESEFMKFINWLNGKVGNEENKRTAKKIKYIFISGDLIDGIGIYPGQEEELTIKDIYAQYDECAKYFKMIPEHIQIIVCAGNHDAVRLSEPQPKLCPDFAKSIYELSNVTIITNPGMVRIHESANFSGFDVLLYHGYSFDYYVQEVKTIRENGKYKSPDQIMKFLLRRRHLAPTHGFNPYIPDTEDDPLVINFLPDFFITGHIHYASASIYRNITMICGSCWQGKTPFQEKLGHEPEPCRVPLVNLQTRAMKILRFDN
jgi:DNA polymerase II small subunit